MAPFWKELLRNAKDKAEYYPQYFIFDKTENWSLKKRFDQAMDSSFASSLTRF